MANILDLVKEVEKMNVSRPYSNDPEISQFLHGIHKEYTVGKKEKIRDMEKSILDVFGEKSKDADDAMEYGMGLSPEELMDIAMSVTPMGGVKAGKGAVSFLKGLLGKAKSKAKFPVGYGEPAKGMSKLGTKKAPPSTYSLIDEAEHVGLAHPERYDEISEILLKRFGGNTKKLERAIDDYYKTVDLMKSKAKPKGMRQFGKFNRQKWEK